MAFLYTRHPSPDSQTTPAHPPLFLKRGPGRSPYTCHAITLPSPSPHRRRTRQSHPRAGTSSLPPPAASSACPETLDLDSLLYLPVCLAQQRARISLGTSALEEKKSVWHTALELSKTVRFHGTYRRSGLPCSPAPFPSSSRPLAHLPSNYALRPPHPQDLSLSSHLHASISLSMPPRSNTLPARRPARRPNCPNPFQSMRRSPVSCPAHPHASIPAPRLRARLADAAHAMPRSECPVQEEQEKPAGTESAGPVPREKRM